MLTFQQRKLLFVQLRGALLLIIGIAVVLAFFPQHAAMPQQAARADAYLLALAADRPDAPVQAIIQKIEQSTAAELRARELGGQILADLPIINAFTVELPARSIIELAREPGVRWASYNAPVADTACSQCIDTTTLQNTYIKSIRADQVWNTIPYRQGQGIGVAVVDSGVNPQQDLYTVSGTSRLIAAVAYNNGYNTSVYDGYGHGNYVAGVIAGNGSRSGGAYIGVAPMANIINVKVSNDQGGATASNVVAGLQWILNNRSAYNIRVVNLSLNSTTAESYHTNPINAAVEILWFNKIVVVVSAGNQGSAALYPPANDPFVITVGAIDDRGTSGVGDDTVPVFSAYGTTIDGFAKPDLVAPGKNVVSLMANSNSGMATAHSGNVVWKNGAAYFRMSGTSVAAPIVAGVAALLLQDEPSLTPDQVKYRLMATANKSWPGYSLAKAGAGYVDAKAALDSTTTGSANTGMVASQLLWSGSRPITWGSVNWNSVNWNSVNWNSVNWNSVNWNSVNWNSDYWGS